MVWNKVIAFVIAIVWLLGFSYQFAYEMEKGVMHPGYVIDGAFIATFWAISIFLIGVGFFIGYEK